MRSSFALLAAISVSGCSSGSDSANSADNVGAGIERIGAAIIGGSVAEESDFRAVVSLGGCSGTLVHPLLVVYAEHCGTAIDEVRFGVRADTPTRVVNTDRCRSFPGAKLGDGTDLAYCVLQEAVVDVEPERVLAGCEVLDLNVGHPAIIVGFGVDQAGGTYGQKRVATTSIMDIGDELFLEQGDADTCRGDSGGPVFIERRDVDGSLQRRLVGVTSAGSEAECGLGIGHYVNLARKIDWLEEHAQLDLTPCFEQGEWAPTPRCVAAPTQRQAEPTDAGAPNTGMLDAGALDAGTLHTGNGASEPPLLQSCGAPFDAVADERPPAIQWKSPAAGNAGATGKSGQRLEWALPDGGAYVEFELDVEATDSGWGVEQVLFSLFADDGELLFQRVDQLAPYGLPILRVPPGQFTLRAEARDFADNTASVELDLQVGEPAAPEVSRADPACFSSPHAPSRGLWQAFALALVLASARRRHRC